MPEKMQESGLESRKKRKSAPQEGTTNVEKGGAVLNGKGGSKGSTESVRLRTDLYRAKFGHRIAHGGSHEGGVEICNRGQVEKGVESHFRQKKKTISN